MYRENSCMFHILEYSMGGGGNIKVGEVYNLSRFKSLVVGK